MHESARKGKHLWNVMEGIIANYYKMSLKNFSIFAQNSGYLKVLDR